MSVTSEIETRSKSNVVAVPIMAVTTRMKKEESKKEAPKEQVAAAKPKEKKKEEPKKANEVVFLVNGETAKTAIVKTGISDDTYIEISEGLTEGQEIVSGGYAAVSRQLEDGKKIKKEDPNAKKKGRDQKA